MAESMDDASSAATTTKTAKPTDAFFTEDLLFLDFPSVSPAPHHQSAFLIQDLLDSTVDGLSDLGPIPHGGEGEGEEDEEEEELEWLSNKDAFPSLDLDFDASSPSPSGSSAGETRSPVSVLAAASPFCFPVRPRSKGGRRRRRAMAGLSAAPATAAALRAVAATARRRCRHCQSEETPQWRAGPDGPKTLCNACGVRYKSGRLLPEYRPASSPSFAAGVHSNSHRRVLEMRRRKGAGGRKGRPASWLGIV